MEEVIETAGLDTIRYWIGPELHLIQYPLRRGELYNQVAVFKSDRYSAESDNWGTEGELEAQFARTHESVRKALAQGACQAVEDAVCLADAYAYNEGDVNKAFRAYQEVRIPRTGRVQRSARLFGDIIHSDGITALLRNALLYQRATDDFAYTDWFDGYQPERKRRSDGH